MQTGATLSGVRLANASNESCGGSLATSFAHSCNSVFAPLGRQARRAAAREGSPRRSASTRSRGCPDAKPSTIPSARELKDDLAVGSAAIGQERDLATALQMASVGATIANRGVRVRPRAGGHRGGRCTAAWSAAGWRARCAT